MSTQAIHPESGSPGSLWRNGDFLRLWAGQTVSMFGSQVTLIALPLIAADLLRASAAQMALLNAIQYAPAVLVGLFAGVWVDRVRRRPILIWADLGRAVLLLVLPLAAAAQVLVLPLIYMVAFGSGVLGVFFGAAYWSYLPGIVHREQLVEGNSRLSSSASVAGIAGPGLGGLLINLLTAPIAIVVDAASFLVSALSIGLIRGPELAPQPPAERPPLWREAAAGLSLIARSPYLRAFQLSSATFDIFWNALYAVYFIYVTRELNLPATAIGIIFSAGSAAALLGSIGAAPLARLVGLGRAIITAQLLLGFSVLLIPLAMRLPDYALVLLLVSEALAAFTNVVYGINRESISQVVTPDQVRGRLSGARSFLGLGVALLGTLLGGLLGEWLGVRATIVLTSWGGLLAVGWLLASPIRSLRSLPAGEHDAILHQGPA